MHDSSPNKSLFKLLYLTFLSTFLSFTFPSAIAEICSLPSNASQAIITRLHNIGLMHSVLKKGEYQGYDIIIISSSTQEEADYQQQILEKTFAGTSKQDGRRPIILSVIDLTEGGQVIGGIYTWIQAENKMGKMYPQLMAEYGSLLDYVRATRSKVAVYHNSGKGERCSPLTQSLGNSRGAQKLVGSVKNVFSEEIELEVLLGVVLQCSSFATTNHGTHIDIFWTSQIAFGSHPHDQLVRSNFEIDKFLVGFDKQQLFAQNILDFGTAALSKTGRMMVFYGNKRFASRKGNEYVIDMHKIETELLGKGERVAYDFGSFAVSLDMWQLLMDYWKKKDVFEKMGAFKLKRDIDPHFIQPLIHFLYGLNDLAHRQEIDAKLPSPSTLITQHDLDGAREQLDKVLKETTPLAHLYIWEDVNHEANAKKKIEATTCMNEVIEFYLLYRQSPVFLNLQKIFGFIDLGDETQWFRYRRPIDIMNEKFEMLTDLLGKKMETQLNGDVKEYVADEALVQRCCEARLMRRIGANEIARFKVEGKEVSLTFSEMKTGKIVEGVYVKGAIIQNCDLTRGSSIVNSVVNNVMGKVIATRSYIESSTAPLIETTTSVIHEVMDVKPVIADREVVSDVYRTKLEPAYHGRMRAPIGYDPKGMVIYKDPTFMKSQEYDETIKYFLEKIPYDLRGAKEYSDETARTEEGRFTFEEIRRIEPLRIADKCFRNKIHESASEEIIKNHHALLESSQDYKVP